MFLSLGAVGHYVHQKYENTQKSHRKCPFCTRVCALATRWQQGKGVPNKLELAMYFVTREACLPASTHTTPARHIIPSSSCVSKASRKLNQSIVFCSPIASGRCIAPVSTLSDTVVVCPCGPCFHSSSSELLGPSNANFIASPETRRSVASDLDHDR